MKIVEAMKANQETPPDPTYPPMKCISWNVRGLWDEQRRETMGHYIKEWSTAVVMLQETMLETCDAQVWNVLGCSHLEGYVALEAVGRSGGVVVAWNASLFAKVKQHVRKHIVAVQLAWLADAW